MKGEKIMSGTNFGKLAWMSFTLLLALASAGCGARETNLTAVDNGGQVTLSPGQALTISLESNPTTGYGWQVVEMDSAILQQTGEPEYKQASGAEDLVGAGGVETLRFEALAAGETTLTLGYMRSWESNPPIETFTMQVSVR